MEVNNVPKKTDAGNGSKGICHVSNTLRSPSPDPTLCPSNRVNHQVLRFFQKCYTAIRRRSADGMSQTEDGTSVLATDTEWLVELADCPIALLSEPQWLDMFWMSYRLTPLTEDPDTLSKLRDVEFWRACEGLGVRFRHRASSRLAANAFPGWTPFHGEDRISMRALY